LTESFVIDASVGFAWVYPSQSSTGTDKLLEEIESGAEIVVPSLWFLEVANGLLAAQRRKLLTAIQRKEALERLSALTFTLDDEPGRTTFRKTSDLAEKHGLTVYDAVYLEIAIRRKVPLASRDEPLRKAAKRSGVKILG
jgi:predicted nucleic acid-binding protein